MSIKYLNTNMNSRKMLKTIMAQEALTYEKLAALLTSKTKRKYTATALSGKLYRGMLRYDELEIIAKEYGYKIKLEKAD